MSKRAVPFRLLVSGTATLPVGENGDAWTNAPVQFLLEPGTQTSGRILPARVLSITTGSTDGRATPYLEVNEGADFASSWVVQFPDGAQWRFTVPAGEGPIDLSVLLLAGVTEDTPQYQTLVTWILAQEALQGKSVELQANGTAIQWRQVGATEWIDLVLLSAISGIAPLPGGYVEGQLFAFYNNALVWIDPDAFGVLKDEDGEALWAAINASIAAINTHADVVASSTVLGHVKIGAGLSIDEEGVLSVTV